MHIRESCDMPSVLRTNHLFKKDNLFLELLIHFMLAELPDQFMAVTLN